MASLLRAMVANVPTGRDPDRSQATIDTADLRRLGRVADADLERFFARNPHRATWRDRVRIVALAEGSAEHYLRRERGVRDLDVIVCFAGDPAITLRRPVVSWDWGPSKFGRWRYDPPEYSGRAVDVKYWVMPDGPDPIRALQDWLTGRLAKHPDPERKPDVAQEPVVLIWPHFTFIAWDPANVPPPRAKTKPHRKPAGLAPP